METHSFFFEEEVINIPISEISIHITDYYSRNRYYAPTIGRFLSIDPMPPPGGTIGSGGGGSDGGDEDDDNKKPKKPTYWVNLATDQALYRVYGTYGRDYAEYAFHIFYAINTLGKASDDLRFVPGRVTRRAAARASSTDYQHRNANMKEGQQGMRRGIPGWYEWDEYPFASCDKGGAGAHFDLIFGIHNRVGNTDLQGFRTDELGGLASQTPCNVRITLTGAAWRF